MSANNFRSLQNYINCNFKDWDLYLIFKFVFEYQTHKILSVLQAIRDENASCQILQMNLK